MNIRDFKASLDYLAKAELTPFLWGHAGVGKTTAVKQWADEKGYKFFAFYLGTQSDLGDVLGLQEFVRDEKGRAVATDFAIPMWLRETIDYCHTNPDSGAVIFLDEFNRARRDILNGMFSLALDKKFHTVQLPNNCHLIAAGNPPTDDYVTTDVDETALMARFVHIKLEPSFDEWLDYAKATSMSANLVEFYRQQPELLEDKRAAFELPVKVDRRAASRMDKIFQVGTPDHLAEQLMMGILGLQRTVAYREFLKKQDKPLTAAEVYAGTRLDLVTKWANPENIQGSLLNLTCENIEEDFRLRNANTPPTMLFDDSKDNLMKFILAAPKDMVYKFVGKLIGEENKVFGDFYAKDDFEAKLLSIIRKAKGVE